MLVDLCFVLISYLIILAFLNNSRWIYLLIQLSLFFRLSGIAIIIGHIGSNVFNYKKIYLRFFLPLPVLL